MKKYIYSVVAERRRNLLKNIVTQKAFLFTKKLFLTNNESTFELPVDISCSPICNLTDMLLLSLYGNMKTFYKYIKIRYFLLYHPMHLGWHPKSYLLRNHSYKDPSIQGMPSTISFFSGPPSLSPPRWIFPCSKASLTTYIPLNNTTLCGPQTQCSII